MLQGMDQGFMNGKKALTKIQNESSKLKSGLVDCYMEALVG